MLSVRVTPPGGDADARGEPVRPNGRVVGLAVLRRASCAGSSAPGAGWTRRAIPARRWSSAATSTSPRRTTTSGRRARAHGGTHVSEPERAGFRDLLDWGLTTRSASSTRRPRAGSPGGTTGPATSTRTSGCGSTICCPPASVCGARRGGRDRPRGAQGQAHPLGSRAARPRPRRAGQAVRSRAGTTRRRESSREVASARADRPTRASQRACRRDPLGRCATYGAIGGSLGHEQEVAMEPTRHTNRGSSRSTGADPPARRHARRRGAWSQPAAAAARRPRPRPRPVPRRRRPRASAAGLTLEVVQDATARSIRGRQGRQVAVHLHAGHGQHERVHRRLRDQLAAAGRRPRPATSTAGTRRDGRARARSPATTASLQVTLGGQPLYYFKSDPAAGRDERPEASTTSGTSPAPDGKGDAMRRRACRRLPEPARPIALRRVDRHRWQLR